MAFAYHQQASTVSPNEQLICSACKVTVLPNERNIHYRSDWHRYNVKRKCVNMEPIEKSVFEEKLKSIVTSGKNIDKLSNKKRKKAMNKTIKKNYDTLVNNDQWSQYQQSIDIQQQQQSSLLNYKCTICNKTFKTHQQCLSHLKTKKHKQEFIKYHKKLRLAQQEEINVYHATNQNEQESSSNNNINPSMDNLIPIDKLKPLLTIENNPFIIIRKAKIYSYNDDEAKFNDRHKNIRLAINTSKSCLFCTQKFEFESESESESESNQELIIKHMTEQHGFFIPLSKRVTDLDKLLLTAGKIIGKYHQCIWCLKQFKSTISCQRHMTDVGHCKLTLENEDSPFIKYFDFDKIIIDSDNDNQDNDDRTIMLREKRHIIDINNYDELVRNDGTIIGHRDNQIVYRQKHRNLSSYNETQTEEQIIAQINNPQRKLKLKEIENSKNIKSFEESGAVQQSKGGKIKDREQMHLQTRSHKVSYQNWVNLQKSKQLY